LLACRTVCRWDEHEYTWICEGDNEERQETSRPVLMQYIWNNYVGQVILLKTVVFLML